MDGMAHEALNQIATVLQEKYKLTTIGDLDRGVLQIITKPHEKSRAVRRELVRSDVAN